MGYKIVPVHLRSGNKPSATTQMLAIVVARELVEMARCYQAFQRNFENAEVKS